MSARSKYLDLLNQLEDDDTRERLAAAVSVIY
jgi:hypothetical protein